MKKYIFLLFIMFHAASFGYYTAENFIDFLVHSNQLRIRLDRLGFNWHFLDYRAAAGITGSQNNSGLILMNKDAKGNIFIPNVMAGFGYEGDNSFNAAAGFEFSYKDTNYHVYTPVLAFNAFNDALRINIPLSIGIGNTTLEGTQVFSTAVEARYYFNIGPLYHMRFYFNYGNANMKILGRDNQNIMQQSVGGGIRIYFRQEVNNVLIDPIIRIVFDYALKTRANIGDSSYTPIDNFSVTAKGFIPSVGSWTGAGAAGGAGANADPNNTLQGGYVASMPSGYYAEEPYRFALALPVGFTASSEFIHFYLEPALSFTLINAKKIYIGSSSASDQIRKDPFYTFGYVVYAEISLRPVPTLEWYSEIQTGGATVAGGLASGTDTELVFNASTGITWYF